MTPEFPIKTVCVALSCGAIGGFSLGFHTAETIYASEQQRSSVRVAAKVAGAVVVAMLGVSTLLVVSRR